MVVTVMATAESAKVNSRKNPRSAPGSHAASVHLRCGEDRPRDGGAVC